MTNIVNNLFIPGYQIVKQLYTGSRTVVYRAIRNSDSLRVVIKILAAEYPTFSELLQFRNQYTIAKNLNVASIVCPLGLETYRNSYMLVMEDFGGISLREYIKSLETGYVLSLEECLTIALQLASILQVLEENRVIHKDIKPANILIHPETKQVKLIDFSIASLLPKETQEIKSLNILEGTLAYISPEQTGRMNRGVDYRSDFYSLGVTLYELVTGSLPFLTDNAMELVHCHIAKLPPPLRERSKGKGGKKEIIPQVIADIVMKLMAKNAEDRYQSALGLKHDLETCLYQFKETGKIAFEIGQRDICDKFIIPEKLYGRENEVQLLLNTFERVSGGSSELILVAGFSGIGKTAVVNEVHKPIVKQSGYFIKGKYDQFNRNIPFLAFVQAFRDLMGQLLTESDAPLQEWRRKILEAVGGNGRVITEVIPELERIIGIQPPVSELSGTAAQNRFNSIFKKFIQVFTTKEHPLVMFLDDLQWADSASFKLIELLMCDSNSGYLLLIGAYRNSEVSPTHPLMMTLEEVHKASAVINSIILQALSENSLNQLIADTLNCVYELAIPLTQLIYQKTQGNPFFSTQFLKALYEDKLIVFNSHLGCWQCDITKVQEAALTDDVVEFMARQLQKLPDSTQEILKLAACIGNQFDLMTLAVVSQQSENETAAALWKALQEGYILPQSEVYKFYIARKEVIYQQESLLVVNYKFSHDRIQQAAYSLIIDEDKQATHLQIGRLLLSNTSDRKTDKLFDIANQFNMGIYLITNEVEKNQVAQINLDAAQKARTATAYSAAFSYAKKGMSLLDDNSWQRQYDLTLGLHNIAADTAFLTGRFAEITQVMHIVKINSQTVLDKLPVYEAQIQAYSAHKNYQKSIDTGLEFLQLLGIKLPSQPSQLQVLVELIKTKVLLRGKSSSKLLQLPVMTNSETIAVLQISNLILYPAFFISQSLMALLTFLGVQKSLKQGNSIWSSSFYSVYSVILSSLQDLEASYQMGQFSLQLLDKFPNLYIEGQIKVVVASFSQIWQQPLSNSLHLIREGKQAALDCGDFAYAGTGYFIDINISLYLGKPLTELPISECHQALTTEIPDESSLQYLSMMRQVMLNLTEVSPQPYILVGTACDETQLIPHFQASNEDTFLSVIYFYKVLLAYLFGNIPTALDATDAMLAYEQKLFGNYSIVQLWFYDALTRLAAYPNSSPQRKKQLLKRVTFLTRNLERRARLVPSDIKHKCDLIRAERSSILGNKLQAQEYYDLAISGAKQNGYIQEEALANELAAKFYLECGKEKIAQVYMLEAYYCYARWGAKAKVTDLEKRYPQLLEFILQQQKINLNINLNPLETIATIARSSIPNSVHQTITSTNGSNSMDDTLDFSSFLKAARTISSNIDLDKLIASLTKIILENCGAKKSVLIIPQDEDTAVGIFPQLKQVSGGIWQVRAITFVNSRFNSTDEIETILETQNIDTCQDIPIKIINYVKNTQKTVILDNCKTDIPGLIGKYMLEHQPKSVLCTPIINQGHLVGILYLENQYTSGVFTSSRLQAIELLSGQAAVSLENARLYQQAKLALQDLQQAQLQIVQSEKMSALGNLVAGVAHEMNNPLGFIAASLTQAKPGFTDVAKHLQLYQEMLPNPGEEILIHAKSIDIDYTLADFPKMLDAMILACDRLENISTSLRTFSRADTNFKQAFNLHEGLDSTILILKHRLKADEQRPAIQVIKEYGNIPKIECFAGQLNQVFMNILANAIDALEESNQERSFNEIRANPNQIKIITSVENNRVKITIADNALGMSEEVKAKIFDHSFTTKVVGKGTGLGLAIAKQIIESKHDGRIAVNSQLGQGTEFVITLPLI